MCVKVLNVGAKVAYAANIAPRRLEEKRAKRRMRRCWSANRLGHSKHWDYEKDADFVCAFLRQILMEDIYCH